MNYEQYLDGKVYKTKTTNCHTSSSSSTYSTCSDNPKVHTNLNKKDLHLSMDSTILSGQVETNEELEETDLSVRIDVPSYNFETNYSINILDQNLDVLMNMENDGDNDVFMDCTNISKSDLSNESTQYMPFESTSQLNKMKSSTYYCDNITNLNGSDSNKVVDNELNTLADTVKLQTNEERLKTIMEETELSHPSNSLAKTSSSINIEKNVDRFIVEMIDQMKQNSDSNQNSAKKVIFTNRDSIINSDANNKRMNQSNFKKQEKSINPLLRKNVCKTKKENIDGTCSLHNTTESFVKWEKYCKDSENLYSRRSFSYSELNSATESCGGDDEYSSSFKTLDETSLCNCSVEISANKTNSSRKFMRHRSKSCDSLLREVRHLPHMVYDRFLKTLSREIEYMRKQAVVCTCQRRNRKKSNKENNDKRLKTKAKSPKTTDDKNIIKEPKLSKDVPPLEIITNKRGLSLETPSMNLSSNMKKLSPKSSNQTTQNLKRLSPKSSNQMTQNLRRLSPKSPRKSPTATAKRLYSWHKEIKSPIREYIKGNSPFKSSPTKKKV